MAVKRVALFAGSLIVPLALIALLFGLLGVTVGDFVRTLARTPAWLLAAVLAITFANQAISVVRWRAASRWLNPKAELVGWGPGLEATAWGSFIGQFLPLQLSMTMARWARSRNRTTVGATLYEQLFDLVVLLSAGGAATVMLAIRGSPEVALAALSLAIVAGCLGVRWLLAGGSLLASSVTLSHIAGASHVAHLIDPLRQASRAPARLLALMAGFAVLRLAILSLRVVLVASVFAGATDWVTTLIGYPIVGLALGVPFVPAGLGIADWSLTGVLILAGAAVPAAALTAAAVRVINIVTLGVTLLALLPFRAKSAQHGRIDRPAAVSS
jgi:hypothetical protein